MTSAYASAPPPFRFGRVELRANARKFLERALVISLLVHLSAAGVFRAVERRAAAREEAIPSVPTWHDPSFIIPLFPMPPGLPSAPGTNVTGVFEPVNRTPPVIQEIDRGDFRPDVAEPEKSGGSGPGPATPNPPPPNETPAFIPVDAPPVPTFAPKPMYPEWAREAGVEGNVLLRVLVGVDGVPKNVVVLSGTKGFTDDAVSAAWRWRFSPGLSNKKPVEVSVEIPMVFRL